MQHIHIGVQELSVNLEGLDDMSVLEEVNAAAPEGVMLRVEDTLAWIHAKHLKSAGKADDLTGDAVGLVQNACNLLRLAANLELAQEFGAPAAKKLMIAFVAGCRERGVSKKTNQLHAVKLGVASKVALADNIEPGVVQVRRGGNVTKKLKAAFVAMGIIEEEDSLDGQYVLVERHPFQLGYVAQIEEVDNLTKNLTLAYRMEFRAVNRGDADGDTLNMFPMPKGWAKQLKEELEKTVAMTGSVLDAALHIRGVGIDEDAETWAENPFAENKTVAKKLNQTFTMSLDEWLGKHKRMTEYATKYTPFAYRISDVAASMAALGNEPARTVALMGAVIEEDYYLGLTGGPKELDAGLEVWFNRKDSKQNRAKIFTGLASVVRPDLLTTPVKIAVLEAARVNQCVIDINDPMDALAHFGFLVGKGKTTTGAHKDVSAVSLVRAIRDFSEEEDIRGSERFLVKMAVAAAKTLAPVMVQEEAQEEDWEDASW